MVDALKSRQAPEGAQVFFVSPAAGATVEKTFTVKLGVEGMGLKPAGDQTPHTGHLVVAIDAPAFRSDQPVPTSRVEPGAVLATPAVVNLSKAETTAEFVLAPGQHTLRAEIVDQYHVPFKPSISSEITVTVA
ncbi:DUF4399 domain-containing protein [Kitasatospora sp. MBT66]|uniref:DUF4399 domain-containing protein n=1 Tax=Kitasatospora sp. MBT66 TaxID=1444769 RepID=UPI0005BD3250|nr:DUF4399 domain-containing protein [Kitasatospora sp. MBT66]